MLLDQNAMMSDGQTVASSAASAHTIDLGAAGNAVPGALFVVCRADEAFAGLTQLKVSLQTDDSAEFTDAEELLSATFALADLGEVKNLFALAMPTGAKRYLRAYYTVTGSATAGKLSCFVTDAVDMK
ncbi:Bbp16 family capsid cement protein [Candidatus Avelusimicrobium alvi]|uniref:Bbp16 family capsid cement protein n=1 Tax=Candidatus Avelusimicrobium alvi TaxID=3416221 RepID=UPI003D0CA7C6